MELVHFVHSFGARRQGRGSADDLRWQFISVWDARTFTQQLSDHVLELLRNLQVSEYSLVDRTSWLRAILLVVPQPSDALALSVMHRGLVVLEATREERAAEVVEQFLRQADQCQGIATSRADMISKNSASPNNPGHEGPESEFSRNPAYFNQALYAEWLEKLSQPWRTEDVFDSDS